MGVIERQMFKITGALQKSVEQKSAEPNRPGGFYCKILAGG